MYDYSALYKGDRSLGSEMPRYEAYADFQRDYKVTEGVSGRGGVSGHAADFVVISTSSSTNKTQPRRARRWGTCMDLPQLGPVAVLLLKSRRVQNPPPLPYQVKIIPHRLLFLIRK